VPSITIDLPKGCDPKAIALLIRAAHQALETELPGKGGSVTLNESEPEGNGAGVVHAYLQAMEARDLSAARALLAPGFSMTFPGPVTMHRLEELIAWAAPRYRFVKKSYERFDAVQGLVYCFGTLSGEWPDGTPFAGIRFIDRFELEGGLITRQDVWNDIAEVKAQ